MRAKLIILLIMLTVVSACSLFGRDRTGYEDSDSIGDLSVPPELNLPERDTNYDIPEAPESAESDPISKGADKARDMAKDKTEAAAEEAIETTVETSE